jgi:flagellin-like protein
MKTIFSTGERGINPLIATILLLLVALAISSLLYGWLVTFTQTKTTQASEQAEETFTCGDASFRILSCSYDTNVLNRGKIEVKMENKGTIDLNDWTIFAEYTDGNVDRNLSKDSNLYAGGKLTVVYTDLTPNKTVKSVKMVPENCSEVTQDTTSCA